MSNFHRKPIIVPTDFSASSIQAIQVAKSIAEKDSDITVVYVGPGEELIAAPYAWAGDEFGADYPERQLKRLQEWIAENKLGDVKAIVRMGDPGLEVCSFATELRCRLIVLPSHGRSGLKRVLLGSVAERIIRHCDCSVLVLRRNENSDSEPISGSWCPRKRVVVPVDFSPSSDDAVKVAKQLVDGGEEVDVINVVPSREPALLGSIVMTDEVRRDNRQESLERFLAEHGHSGMRAHAVTGDPGTTICDYANEVNADVVVIPSHGYQGMTRLLLGSTAERVVRHCSAPVLVLRRKDDAAENE